MYRHNKLMMLSAVAGLLLPGAAFAAVAGIETFDADTAGFVASTLSSTVVHSGTGGNPDGHILVRKDLSVDFQIGALTTDADFTGDYAAAGIVQAAVDVNFVTDNVTAAWLRFRPDVATNGWRYPLTAVFPQNVWNTYTVNFNPAWTNLQATAAGWITDQDAEPGVDPSPSFASVMSGVYSAEVRFASDGSTIVGIDNFALVVPEPTTGVLALLCAGFVPRRQRRS
jgi:hypothetical protein